MSLFTTTSVVGRETVTCASSSTTWTLGGQYFEMWSKVYLVFDDYWLGRHLRQSHSFFFLCAASRFGFFQIFKLRVGSSSLLKMVFGTSLMSKQRNGQRKHSRVCWMTVREHEAVIHTNELLDALVKAENKIQTGVKTGLNIIRMPSRSPLWYLHA